MSPGRPVSGKGDSLFFAFDGEIEDLFEGIEIHLASLMGKIIIDETGIRVLDCCRRGKPAPQEPAFGNILKKQLICH
jgi:hypothetical protein